MRPPSAASIIDEQGPGRGRQARHRNPGQPEHL